jgi:hypothetical protein
MPTRLRRTSVGLACAALAATALLAGCGSSGTPVTLPSDTATSSSASPSTPVASRGPAVHPAGEKDILAAYTGMLNAYAVAAETNDTANPGLITFAKGEARKQLGLTLINARGRNVHGEGRPVSDPWIESATPDLNTPTGATVVDCVDTSNWLQHNADGSVVAGDKGGRRLYTAVLDNADGSWKVNALTTKAIGSC